MALSSEDVRRRIDSIVDSFRPSGTSGPSLLRDAKLRGKLYEAWILVQFLRDLERNESATVELIGSSKLYLKSSPGAIDRGHPYFLIRMHADIFEVWTDIEVMGLALMRSTRTSPSVGDYFEMDVVMTRAGASGRPCTDEVVAAIECKNTVSIRKSAIREMLGIRRHLSLLTGLTPTVFYDPRRQYVPADPPSVVEIHSSDSRILEFAAPLADFGIRAVFARLP